MKKEKQKQAFTGLLSLIFAVGSFSACGGGNESSASGSDSMISVTESPSSESEPAESSVDETVSPWTEEPEIIGEFFSDFGRDEVIGEGWSVVNYSWGQNGVARENAGFTRSPGVVNALGATGGVIVLNSYGDYYHDPAKRGQGACLISNELFGPGKYEVRMKIVPRFGPCSTMWSYYTNSYAIDTPSGPVYGHNTAENIQYHEIDVECPRIGRGFYGWGGVAYEEYYQDAENLGTDGLGKVVNHSTSAKTEFDSPYNDGQWHVFGFEWRTEGYDYDESAGENPGAVIWYMDGKEVARTAKNTPYYPDQLWIGNWFPDNATDWLGIADFDEAYMYIDWVRITEYADEYRTTNKDGTPIQPELGGCVIFSTSPGGNKDWGANLPVNNYISNGAFAYGEEEEATGWTLKNAKRMDDGLQIEGGSATQMISAQYGGYTFCLTAEGEILSGGGNARVYVEYIHGEYPDNSNSNARMTEKVIGRSEALFFDSAGTISSTLELTLPEETNNIRLVLEADDGTVSVIKSVSLYLQSDTEFL